MADNEISGTENANGVPQLKPCPFCGGEAKVNTLQWNGGYTATALCKNEPNAHYLNTWDEDEAKAVERITDAWNTRAERTCRLRMTTVGWGCSACHVVSWTTERKPKPNYCPNCGAKVVDE